ncbi:hypothetical protein [Mucilaginibacter gotjawali]|uniref:Uncharacterized protein n=1 Tax=Mucilaginibacter gotjawali TaxID=1550579 RepID=A0A839SEE8_9SPHI|nr:hypothetical protein [Mucilaginibacter gotjawali]MBB3056166.1 hypothetical protein [Mucilaginibacter gotjawali]
MKAFKGIPDHPWALTIVRNTRAQNTLYCRLAAATLKGERPVIAAERKPVYPAVRMVAKRMIQMRFVNMNLVC